jgi:hypothetical protein
MIRIIAISVALILLTPACLHAEEDVGAPDSCPRPTDQYGPRYQIMAGAYQSRGETQGGEMYLTMIVDGSPHSVPVSGNVFRAAGKVRHGARITLVGYAGHSMSGAMPPFSCIELAP